MKANKLKANELMVGDRVLHDGKYKEVITIWPHSVSLYDSSQTWGSIYADNHTESEIEPIPITPEILEKNGFIKWEYGYIWKERIGMGGQTVSASSPIEIIIYEGGHSVILNPHDGKEYQGEINSIHELQHALKLCGIEQEIVL